jgi:hypothetical protein
LAGLQVTDVTGVHAENTSDSAEGEEDDSHDGERVDGGLLAVFVGFDLLDVLHYLSINGRQSRTVKPGMRNFTYPNLKINSPFIHFLEVPDPLLHRGKAVLDQETLHSIGICWG